MISSLSLDNRHNIYIFTNAFAAETHPVEGQWLKEQLNMVKLHMFRVGTRMLIISRAVGQYLVSVKIFIKNKAWK
jgi:hypothetical protein